MYVTSILNLKSEYHNHMLSHFVFLFVGFQDGHALGEYEPIIDESQDVTLLSANQNDTHTILRFSRPYVTCDENDRDITVIFNYSDVCKYFTTNEDIDIIY